MSNDNFSDIGTRIAEIRRSHKTTQEELANMLDVSPKHISHVENSTSSLSLKNLVQFCTIYNCSLDYLILGKTNNQIIDKLPDEIVKTLSTGTQTEIDRLNRYLNIYVEISNQQD